ncbi:fibronectin type III domain-containing protein [Aeromonas caviae]|uniref:fibronectin type III domain-containing protein n=1 Tax=Aeromonas caviae TaxID=648 RepID=UPI0029D8AE16|nr:fibronectin type III domain-containing protein [Aeromonas caviae]MDX7825734.1 fibronectin type III domain-containing protein [Aeromonas caviae]
MGLEISAIAAIVSAAISTVSLAISLTAKQPSMDQTDVGVGVDRRGQDNPILIPFGDCLLPCARSWSNTNRYNTDYFAQIFCIGLGEVKSINQIFINGVPYFNNTLPQTIGWHNNRTSANFPNVSIGLKRGLPTESAMFTQIIQNSDGEVSANFRGDGIASLNLLVERWVSSGSDNEIRFINTTNKIEALVSGIPVIDPRTDPNCLGRDDKSKRVWGSSYTNPACCILTYLLDPYFGMGLQVEDVDITSFILLANYCDNKQLKFNGFVNQDSTFGEILKDFAASFDGDIYLESGLIKVRPIDVTASLVHLDESSMHSEIRVLNKGGEDYANTIIVEYLNKDSNYSQDKYVIPKNQKTDPVIQKDGYIKEKTLKLPFLVDGSAGDYAKVKWFANRAYKRAQLQKKSISFKIDNTVTKLKLGDVVEISNTMFNMDHKKFRVVSIKSSMDDKILISDIEAVEYIPEVFDTSGYQTGGNSGSLPEPSLIINPPNNLVFTQNTGTVQGHGVLSWSSQYRGDQRNEVQYRKTGSTTWVTYQTVAAESVTITNLQTGTNYDFRVRTMAAVGYSRFTELLNQRIAKVLTLPAVTGLTGDFTGKDAIIRWNAVKGAIPNLGNPVAGYSDLSELVSYYQVQIAHTTVGNIKSTHICTDPSFTYSLEQNRKDGLSRNIWVIVTPVSIFADVGASTQVNLYNEPMTQPASVQARSELINLTIEWLNVSETVKDYEASDIWVTQSKAIPPTSAEYVSSSSVGWWTSVLGGKAPKSGYAWIAHRDVYGHPSSGPVYSVPVYYSETTIDDLLTDSQFEANVESIENNLTQAQADITKAKADITKSQADILANASEINTVKSTVAAQGVQITNVQTVANSNTGKIASLETEISAAEADLNAKITTNKNAITTTNQAMTSMDTRLTAAVGSNTSAIQTNTNAIATTNQAMTSMDTRLTSAVGSNTSAIQQQGIAISNLDSSLSLYKQENTAEVNGVKSSVTQLSQAQATTDGKVNSLYTLKVDANGKVAGMSLGATSQGSTVDFLADTFRIASSAGTQSVFEVRGGKTMIKSLLVGDITASQISADAINGNHIAANSIIQAGSGATSATLNGADANWRIYAGSTTPGSAPFRVSTTGALIATNATITGAITATSGSFSGAITASSGSISGRLTMNGGFIDGRSGQDSISLGNNAFRVDNNGNLYASNGTFGGTIYADKISGDITNAGLFTFPAVSQTVTSGTLHDVFRMNVPAVSWERYMLISLIPLNWRSLENGGRFNMFLRDSTGRNTNIFGENKPMGTIDGYPSLDNFSIRIPANATWVALSVQGDRRQSVGFGQLPIETNWQVFKAGSGGISISAG